VKNKVTRNTTRRRGSTSAWQGERTTPVYTTCVAFSQERIGHRPTLRPTLRLVHTACNFQAWNCPQKAKNVLNFANAKGSSGLWLHHFYRPTTLVVQVQQSIGRVCLSVSNN